MFIALVYMWHAVPEEDSSEEIEQATEIRKKFTVELRNYIRGNALKQTILHQMTEILVGTSLYMCLQKALLKS